MAACQNCRAQVGCSCVLRPASNGIVCCPNCLQVVEQRIAEEKRILQESLNNPQPPNL